MKEALARVPKIAESAAKKPVQEEKPATAAPPAVTAGPEHGVLAFNASPEAVQLSIDGNAAGATPTKVKLAAGKHKIRAVVDGYDAWEKEVEVLADSEMTLKSVMKKSGS